MFPTTALDLIKQLQALVDKHSNLPVASQGGEYYTSIPSKFIKLIAGYPCEENDTIDNIKTIFTNPTYLDLVADFTPRPIKSIGQRKATQEVVDKLIDKPQSLNQDEQDYLSVLGTLLYEYDIDSMPDTWFEELI